MELVEDGLPVALKVAPGWKTTCEGDNENAMATMKFDHNGCITDAFIVCTFRFQHFVCYEY